MTTHNKEYSQADQRYMREAAALTFWCRSSNSENKLVGREMPFLLLLIWWRNCACSIKDCTESTENICAATEVAGNEWACELIKWRCGEDETSHCLFLCRCRYWCSFLAPEVDKWSQTKVRRKEMESTETQRQPPEDGLENKLAIYTRGDQLVVE